jgi:hypothetical protein
MILRSLFTFIDFGGAARPFLMHCGTKSKPDVGEMYVAPELFGCQSFYVDDSTGIFSAQMLVADPRRFYALARTPETFLTVLRVVAANAAALPNGLKRQMRNSAFLLGGRRVVSTSGRDSMINGRNSVLRREEDEEPESFLQYQLTTASELVIVVRNSKAYGEPR